MENVSPVRSLEAELTTDPTDTPTSSSIPIPPANPTPVRPSSYKQISSTRLGSLRLSIEGIDTSLLVPPSQPSSSHSNSNQLHSSSSDRDQTAVGRSRSSSTSNPVEQGHPRASLSRKGSFGGDPALGRILASRRFGSTSRKWEESPDREFLSLNMDGGGEGSGREGGGIGLGLEEYCTRRNGSAPELPIKNFPVARSLPSPSSFRQHRGDSVTPPMTTTTGRRLTSTNLAIHRHSFHAKTPFDFLPSSENPLPPGHPSSTPHNPYAQPSTATQNRGIGIIGGEASRPIFLRTASGTNLRPASRRIPALSELRNEAPLPATPSTDPNSTPIVRRRKSTLVGGAGGDPRYVLRPTRNQSTQTDDSFLLRRQSESQKGSKGSLPRIWKALPGTSGAAPYHVETGRGSTYTPERESIPSEGNGGKTEDISVGDRATVFPSRRLRNRSLGNRSNWRDEAVVDGVRRRAGEE